MKLTPVHEELGATAAALRRARRGPVELAAFKVEAKRRYRKLVCAEHPDRVGDSKRSNGRLAALNVAMGEIDSLKPERFALAPTPKDAGVPGFGTHVSICMQVWLNGERIM